MLRSRARPTKVGAGSGFVYVIRGDHGMAKVGSSNNPERRLAELQTGSPYLLWIDYRVAVSGRAADVEFAAQGILNSHRGLGEWFAVPTEMAIAAIHAAAYRMGVGLDGAAVELRRANWRGRLVGAALVATPFWFALAVGIPALAMGYMFVAMVGFVLAFIQRAPDQEPPLGNFCRWVGVAIFGGALAAVPAAVFGAAMT